MSIKVAVVSRKGGAGKSTLCANLGVCAHDALLVDCDPQGTLTGWYQSRPEHLAFPELLTASPGDVRKVYSERQWILIDTPPHTEIEEVIASCQRVVLCVRPSIFDLRAVAGSVALLRGRKAGFVLNAVPPPRMILGEAAITKEARKALEAFGLPICPVAIAQRHAFVTSAIAGLGVTEWDDEKAASEVLGVWQWLSAL